MTDFMQRTTSSKVQVADWQGNEPQASCVAGAVITITPSGNFRLLRISLNFDGVVAPTVNIEQVNQAGAAWNQNIRNVAVPAPAAGNTDYTLIGGQGYEYRQGDSIQVTISAVAANVNCSWAMEQI